jgi:hypothetical protein
VVVVEVEVEEEVDGGLLEVVEGEAAAKEMEEEYGHSLASQKMARGARTRTMTESRRGGEEDTPEGLSGMRPARD